MREIYFNDDIDDSQYSGKLYGFGQTFSTANGIEAARGGATLAEREDRQPHHNQTVVPTAGNGPQTPGVTLMGPMQPVPPGMGYGPLGAAGPYMRTSLVGGGR